MADLGIQNLWLFILAGWALNLTPGPDVFYMVGSTLRGGMRAGVVAMAGIFAGCLAHVLAATIGLSALIAASATAFMVLKWIGAAYLIYIGWKMLRTPAPTDAPISPSTIDATHAHDMPPTIKTIFIQGFLSNALNPKVALFFLAFLPQFIDAQAPQATLGFLILGLIFNINAVPVNMGYVVLAAWVSRRMNSLQSGLVWLERAAGAMFIGFGVKLALSEK
ncbi:MAG: LysE family translocator [Brachymonas sp.]|nr:LysE family translocator [Brachymonas sp.]